MNLTVGKLREIIENLDDNVILADLELGNYSFSRHTMVKRVMLLKSTKNDQRYLTINRMGSHFTGEKEQKELVYDGLCWD